MRSCKLLENNTRRSRCSLGACGKVEHGKRVDGNSVAVCYACDRPKDEATGAPSRPWRHVGDGPYWAGLTDWAYSVQGCWRHGRNILDTPLQAGECLCSRSDCAFLMYKMFVARRTRMEKGAGSRLEIGQPSPVGSFPTLAAQVSHRTGCRQQQKVDIPRLWFARLSA